jgi:hypothetical protein
MPLTPGKRLDQVRHDRIMDRVNDQRCNVPPLTGQSIGEYLDLVARIIIKGHAFGARLPLRRPRQCLPNPMHAQRDRGARRDHQQRYLLVSRLRKMREHQLDRPDLVLHHTGDVVGILPDAHRRNAMRQQSRHRRFPLRRRGSVRRVQQHAFHLRVVQSVQVRQNLIQRLIVVESQIDPQFLGHLAVAPQVDGAAREHQITGEAGHVRWPVGRIIELVTLAPHEALRDQPGHRPVDRVVRHPEFLDQLALGRYARARLEA